MQNFVSTFYFIVALIGVSRISQYNKVEFRSTLEPQPLLGASLLVLIVLGRTVSGSRKLVYNFTKYVSY